MIESRPKMIIRKDEVLFFKMTFLTFKYLAILKNQPLLIKINPFYYSTRLFRGQEKIRIMEKEEEFHLILALLLGQLFPCFLLLDSQNYHS
jgi:hypothetical protein